MTDQVTVPPPEDNIEGLKKNQEKLKKEKENTAMALKLEQDKVKDLEAKLKESDDEKLKQVNDYKSLYENTQKDLGTLKQTLAEKKTQEEKSHKLAAVTQELVKLGANQEGMGVLLELAQMSIDKVQWNEEHKIALGVEDLAKGLKEKASLYFGKQSAGASHAAPQGNNAVFNLESWRAMSPAEKAKANPYDLLTQAGIELKK